MDINSESGIGAYVTDIDLNNLNTETLARLKTTLGEYGVLFFRNQSMTSENHIVFAEHFGAININRFFTPLEDYPQIAQVLKEPEHSTNIGSAWHTDHSYDQIPALGSILVARELPASGGDTLFASMYAAYDALTADMKKKLEGLSAVHSSRHAFGADAYKDIDAKEVKGRLGNTDAATQDAIHPVVIAHPISGKRAIYVNPDFTTHICDMPADESEDLLDELYRHCMSPEFSHRFKWEPGSVAFWDNRATWHMALNDYAGQRRLMHRITVEGVPLFSA